MSYHIINFIRFLQIDIKKKNCFSSIFDNFYTSHYNWCMIKVMLDMCPNVKVILF